MRLAVAIFVTCLLAVCLVQAQESRRRGSFRALAERAKSGDPDAQAAIRATRRRIVGPDGRPARRRRIKNRVRVESSRSQVTPPEPIQEEPPAPPPTFPPEPVRISPTTFRPRSPPPTPAPTLPPQEPDFTFFTEQQPIPTEPPRRPPPPPPTEDPRRFNRPEPPRPTISRTRGQNVIEENLFGLEEPHRALQSGLEVDSRSETFHPRRGNESKPIIETIRRYSFYDEEGNYIFGYEAADGSFKEEKRGLDCIVHGKYGYIDPTGVRREFTYVSGNRCDPNAIPNEHGEIPELPPNNQFLTQTDERRLAEEELSQLQVSARRKAVNQQQQRPQQPRAQRPQQQQRPQQPRPQRPEQQQRAQHSRAQRPQQQQIPSQSVRQRGRRPNTIQAEIPVVDATLPPPPSSRFTTPASFNTFNTQTVTPAPQQTLPPFRPPTPPPVAARPAIERPTPPRAPAVRIPEPSRPSQRPRPRPPQISSRPSRPPPTPANFDFDQEFKNLFNNFADTRTPAPRPVAQTPRPPVPSLFAPATFPTFSARPTPRPAPQPTLPPAPRPTRPPPPPPTRAPPQSRPPPPPPPGQPRPSLDDGSRTLTQLVFDRNTGAFKTVRIPAPTPNESVFNKRPTQAPLVFRPVTPSQSSSNPRPRPPASEQLPTGVPLPGFSQAVSSSSGRSPLPAVPLGQLFINNPQRSPAAADFDRFFKQFQV